jgi:hypothetical protein
MKVSHFLFLYRKRITDQQSSSRSSGIGCVGNLVVLITTIITIFIILFSILQLPHNWSSIIFDLYCDMTPESRNSKVRKGCCDDV